MPDPKQAPKQAVVLLSGGLDSMVAAGIARERGFRLLALTDDYNQRHRIELDAAARDEALSAAIDYVMKHPRWRLSLQTHKLLGLP